MNPCSAAPNTLEKSDGSHHVLRRMIVELAAIWLALLLMPVVIHINAARIQNAAGLGPEKRFVVADPAEAFSIWRDAAVRDRVLVLFDRHLRADAVEPCLPPFAEREFSAAASVTALCDAVRHDGLGAFLPRQECSVEDLNALLRQESFHDAWLQGARSGALLLQVEAAERNLSFDTDADLNQHDRAHERKLISLNRTVLEATYPGLCPKAERYPLTNDNYMYAAKEEGYIREIYHVVPDSAWPEIQRALEKDRAVAATGNAYRLVIGWGWGGDWAPVTITRMKDLPVLKKRVLVMINRDVWGKAERADIARLLRNRTIVSDLLIDAGGESSL